MLLYKDEYQCWLENAVEDDLHSLLRKMSQEEIEDAFYKNLAFGTGGLRGTIGAGTNRMNVYTVAKASQGLADYLVKKFSRPSVVIGFDSRIKSDVFARTAASVFAANGVLTHLWPHLNPVPTVSFAVRYLSASAGIMITASHNPSKYNGYKVYGEDGCQITTKAAAVTRTLKEMGYTNITLVEEQRLPDGAFPTCPYPNPEIREAMALGLEYARRCNADLLLATDPDCDRVGIAVKDDRGEYVLLSGNETGLLLLDYICSQRAKHHKMPDNPVMVKTIVTMDLAERIAADYGVRAVNVLTGFKYIGEQIGFLEQAKKTDSFVFGFEESYGYLSGSYVRDKDAVAGAFLICEMFSYYAAHGSSIWEKLQELFSRYGYCLNTLHSYEFDGPAGFEKMKNIMRRFHEEAGPGKTLASLGGKKILKVLDYSQGLSGLPKSDVLKYLLEGNCAAVIRPSGTEPKLKVYISVSAKTKAEAQEVERKVVGDVERVLR